MLNENYYLSWQFTLTQNHTQYSNLRLRDCIIKEDDLIKYAVELGHEVVAITDHEAVCNAVKVEKIYKKIKKDHPDFKVILGNEIYLCRNGLNASNFNKDYDRYWHFILLAKDAIGHRQIREISSHAWRRSYMSRGMRRVPTYYQDLIDIIQANPGHVIGTTACLGGALPTQLLKAKNNPDLYEKIYVWVENMNNIFGQGNFYFELQPSESREQTYVNRQLIYLSNEMNIPYIITTDSHYLKKEDKPIHKAYLNSQNGDREVDDFYATTYMMDTEELESHMDLTDEELHTAYANIHHIKEMCEDYSLLKPLKIPQLPWRDLGSYTIDQKYWISCIPYLEKFWESDYEGDNQLADTVVLAIQKDPYLQTDEAYNEINVNLEATWKSSIVNKTHWSAYFLNLQKIVDECWNAGTLVGPSRGSGGGFILLYLLGITQINPLREKTKLFHWRFLNPERASVLDIDTDIEGGRRQVVLNHLRKVYGEDRVANVATFGTEKSKSAILTACLKPGTLINTNTGLKEIEKITANDIVDTTEGPQKVITPTHRYYDGDLYTFNTSGIGVPFSVTHNHQLLVYTNRKKQEKENCQNYKECQLFDRFGNVLGVFTSVKQAAQYYADKYNGSFSSMYKYKRVNGYYIVEKPAIKNHQIQWLTAEEIQKTDFLLSPIYKPVINTNNYVSFTLEEQNPSQKSVVYIKDKIRLDENFCELIGIYLAEGNINYQYHGITFTINQKEVWLKERIIYLLNSVFGIDEKNIHLYYKKDSEGLSIQVNSTPLGRFFNKYFPGDCSKKMIGFIKNLPANLQIYTLYGCYYGDGYGRKRKNNNYEGKITSVSYQLTADLWQIAANNGYNCSVVTENRTSSNKRTNYNLMFYGKTAECLYNSKYLQCLDLNWETQKSLEYNGIEYYPIRINKITKEKYQDEVFCLETLAHNYLLNNIVSHNCRGLGIDVDIAQYLSSMIESDRGQLRTLNQTFYGDKDKGFAPNKQFVYEMTENYPEVWEVAQKIEGLVSRLGVHAGGVVFVDEPFTESAALLRAPDGTICTQFELHDLEEVSMIKMDLLSIDALDKIHTCLDLLIEQGYIKSEATLRETYEKTVGIYNLERDNIDMWKMVWEHKIESLFQMEKQSGIRGIAIAKPKTIDELAVLNSVIRLMAAEKGAEMPLEMWGRYRQDINQWIAEMRQYGLSEENIEWLSHHSAITDGICESQEGLMSLVQEERLGGNSLSFADSARKALAKKIGPLFEKCEKEFFENAEKKNCDMTLAHYVWDVLLRVQRGYSFCRAHTLAYSFVALQEMNLAYKFPISFWNCACLISDSGGTEGNNEESEQEIICEEIEYNPMEDFGAEDTEEDEEDNEDDDEDEEDNAATKKKKKTKSANYGKIATAIGKIKSSGVDVAPPDINKSNFTFYPDVENNVIRYGLSGITKVGEELVKTIIDKRPYSSVADLTNKVKINKAQVINLIKSGAFDCFGDRVQIMREYISSISDTKKRITLQNMKMLCDFGLIPEKYDMQRRVYNFNKYLKKFKINSYYGLDEIAIDFYEKNFDMDKLYPTDETSSGFMIKQTVWDAIYQSHMDKIRPWVKENAATLLKQVNERLVADMWNKYCQGSLSKWEMDSVCFYSHEHELSNVNMEHYELSDFNDLPENPIVERIIPIKGKAVPIFKLHRICGTVLDKDKAKKTITLLTTSGVVTVKIFGAVFTQYDKQISERGADGKKHVIEKSMFARGNKIIVIGVRDGDSFRAKKYSRTPYHLVEQIIKVNDDGSIITKARNEQEG